MTKESIGCQASGIRTPLPTLHESMEERFAQGRVEGVDEAATGDQGGKAAVVDGNSGLGGNMDDADRVLRSLRAIALGNGPTPATLKAWVLRLSEGDAAALVRDRIRLPPPVTRALGFDLSHILGRGKITGAFSVGDEAAAVRFALDVAFLTILTSGRPAASPPADEYAGSKPVLNPVNEDRSLFLLRAWGHVGAFGSR